MGMLETGAKLSLALITKNEGRCLARCLKSIQQVVDEIVLVDTGSTDDTVEIARQFNARIFHFEWINDFSAARNYGLAKAKGDWLLVLDADEHASEALAAEIRSVAGARQAIGRLKIVSDFKRNNQLFRSQSFVSRLFPRGAHFEGRIHEQLVSPLPRVNLRGELWHDGYLEPVKSDRNIQLLVEEMNGRPKDAYLMFQLAIEYTALNRTEEACRYLESAFGIARLDEPFVPNLIVDYLYALTELKRYETGLAVIEKGLTLVNDFPDFHLACGLFYMNLVRANASKYIAYLPRIENSFKQSLSLGESEKYKSVAGSGTFLAYYNLGTLYHVFGNAAGARECFEKAAGFGYEPARQFLKRL